MNMKLTKEYTGGKVAIKDRRRPSEDQRARKRARRVTFEGSSRTWRRRRWRRVRRQQHDDEAAAVVARGWRRGDGESGVGGGEGTVKSGVGGGEDGRGRWRRRRWRRGWSMDGGGRDGGEGRWSRREGDQRDGDGGCGDGGDGDGGREDDLDEARGEQRRGEISVARGKKTGTRGTRERPLFFFLTLVQVVTCSHDFHSGEIVSGNHDFP
ncbi:hypothetical protein Syun_010847 [Stephania yunnanensis]|uniref:Uncharacterized protein n=1 Tax=Stephania yunnanensis TaxID=152371 RepID=A0AAP0JWG8_9MAGN